MMRIVGVIALLQGSLAQAAEMTLQALFQQAHPAVVTVYALEQVLVAKDSVGIFPVTGQGSGVMISAEGEVLTAAHLVHTADAVRVEFADGATVDAEVLTSEPMADVALLRLEHVPSSAAVANLADSDRAQVGERVIVIGAPYGLSHTLSVGYISARHAPGVVEGGLILAELLQTDAAINRGNSGGPMLNMAGEVIGIVSYILSQSGSFEGVGFAVSSNTVRDVLLDTRALWTGMTWLGLSGRLAKVFNLPQDSGILVQRIAKGSAAARLGLLPSFIPARIGDQELLVGGDIILSVDGITLSTPDEYRRLRSHLTEVPEGHVVAVEVLRHGTLLDLSIPVVAR